MARKIYRVRRRVAGLAGGIGLIGLVTGLMVIPGASIARAAIGDCNDIGKTGEGVFLEGAGTLLDPYVVTTSAQLVAIGTTDCLDENYRQNADIALTGTWTPISDFVGTYDGGRNEITNLVLSGGAAGLFNVGSAGATVKNLTVQVSSTEGATQDVGAIVGRASGPLVITNVHVFGNVSGSEDGVGGLVGIIPFSVTINVTNSSVNGDVSAGKHSLEETSWAGGVVGWSDGPVEISATSVEGDVSGTGYDVGGLVGGAGSTVVVSNSTVTGDVSGSLSGVGGLVGGVGSTVVVSDSWVDGDVSAGDNGQVSFVGGVVGWSDGPVEITNVDVIGRVLGTGNSVGGLIGDVATSNQTPSTVDVSGSSVTGNVSGTGSSSSVSALVGGVIGSADSAVTISATSVIGDVSGTGDSVGGLVGEAGSTLDVSGSSVNGTTSAGSTGADDFLSRVGGVVGFVTGAVTISATSVIGNVWGTTDGAEVNDDKSNTAGHVGGLVGSANERITISKSAVIGNVTGYNGVGGLVGRSFVGPLATENAFYRGTVSGLCFCFGGIVGSDSGQGNTTLTNTYVAESQLEFVGDFVDSSNNAQDPLYVDSFCTGVSADDVVDSCQDVNSDQRVTVAQLKSKSFLSEQGWDFDTVWCVSPNVNGGYPVLRAITASAVGFAACWAAAAVVSPAPQVRQVTLDPNGGVCMVDGQRRDVSWSTKFVDNHYLPGNKDCEREGFTFEGWADIAKPDVVLDLPKLAQPTDGVTRPFLTRSADLIAVWKKPDETDIDTDDLTGTAPGAFVGGADRRTREGGAVVDGYYIPPNTLFGPWMLAK